MASNATTAAALASAVTVEDLDAAWLVLNAQQVFLMQTGFLLLEASPSASFPDVKSL